MNIFKSKEIYKRIPGVSPELNPLRKARGVYVSGEYLPPFYIDAGLHLKNVYVSGHTIQDYTEVNQRVEASGPTITDASITNMSSVVKYTIETKPPTYDKASSYGASITDASISDLSYIYSMSTKELPNSKDVGSVYIKSITDANLTSLSFCYSERDIFKPNGEPGIQIVALSSNSPNITEEG